MGGKLPRRCVFWVGFTCKKQTRDLPKHAGMWFCFHSLGIRMHNRVICQFCQRMRFFFHSLGVPMHKPVICHMWQDSKATLFPTICIPKMPFKYDNIYVMRGGFYIFHDESEKKKWKQTDKMKSWGRKNRGRRDKWKEKIGEQITLLI